MLANPSPSVRKFVAAGAALVLLASAAAPADDWTFYRRDLMGSASSPETLTAAQAAALQPDWIFFTNGLNYANPIVANGTVYVTSGDGGYYALDALTGALRWKNRGSVLGPFHCFDPKFVASKGPVGAPAVVGNTVFFPGANGIVSAYDTATGRTRWQTKIADVNDKGEFLWTSGFPLNGKLYYGISSLHDCLLVPGKVISLDQQTGNVLGTWWADDSHGPGGGVWTQPAYDARTNRLFLTTGTIAAGLTPPQQPNADAFVAINPDTMTTVDRFSPIPDPYVADLDFGASPTLYDTPDGRHFIAAADKNGIVYALDRDNLAGGVVWQYRISGAGASPDLGESTIVSAPFANGMLFVAGGKTLSGQAGAVAALDGATGTMIWQRILPGFVLGAMTTVGDVLIFGATILPSYKGKLYVVSQATGADLMPPMDTAGALFGEPTWANGVLYVGDLKGAFYALTVPGVGPAADFALSLNPTSVQVSAGQSVTLNAYTTSPAAVTLSASGLPSNITASFSPPTAMAGAPSTLTLSLPAGAGSAPPNPFTVTASRTDVSHSANASVQAMASDFTLALDRGNAVLTSGGSLSIRLTTQAVAGAPETIVLSANGLPAGVAASFSPAQVAAGGASTLTLQADPAAQAANSTFSVTANAPSASHSASARLRLLTLPAVRVSPPSTGVLIGTASITVAATVSPGTTLASVALLADGAQIARATTSPATLTWDTTQAVSGPHILSAVVTDGDGNQAHSPTVPVQVDDQVAPTLSLASPGSSGKLSGVVAVQVNAAASGRKTIAKIELLLDGAVAARVPADSGALQWDASHVTAGAHTLQAIATDSLGNAARSAAVTVKIDDLQPPAVSLNSPAAGTVSGLVQVQVAAQPSGQKTIDSLELRVDGVPAGQVPLDSKQLNWDTRTVGDGAHDVTVRATDSLGDAADSSAVRVTVRNKSGGCSSAPDAGVFALLGLLALWRRRDRPAAGKRALGHTLIDLQKDGCAVEEQIPTARLAPKYPVRTPFQSFCWGAPFRGRPRPAPGR